MKKNRGKINKLVVIQLDKCGCSHYQPTAGEIYHDIRHIEPNLRIGGFKSFVKVLNSFPEVEGIRMGKGKPFIYKKIFK